MTARLERSHPHQAVGIEEQRHTESPPTLRAEYAPPRPEPQRRERRLVVVLATEEIPPRRLEGREIVDRADYLGVECHGCLGARKGTAKMPRRYGSEKPRSTVCREILNGSTLPQSEVDPVPFVNPIT